MRAVRAAVVLPGLFALTFEGLGNVQMATFAAFGGFATLVMASFGGRRRDRAVAHLGLAVVGSVLLTIGTAVHSVTWLAALVTLPVAFAVLFAGVIAPNLAAGATAALLAYVLPAASPGTLAMVPDRLAGWWLASVVGTLAVLLISPRPPADALRDAASGCARALADLLGAGLRAEAGPDRREASVRAKHRLTDQFTSTPYRPTSLTNADQALAGVVGMLEWSTALLCDSLSEYGDLRDVPEVERDLFAATGAVLRDVAGLLDGADTEPDLGRLDEALEASVTALRHLSVGTGHASAVDLSFHARTLGIAVRAAAVDTLVAVRRADPETVAEWQERVYGIPERAAGAERRLGVLAAVSGVALHHASLRSVWLLNSVRGAAGLAAAIAVADVSGVQHGFWVVLGTLSVLRTSAASTGATVWRALLGTVAGFAVGAALITAIGTGSAALWAALPIAVLVAGYAPGTAPFAVGQAAFTVVVSVLYNLLAPVGWQVGVLRIEDVAIGGAVSLAVGLVFWPRGAGQVVRTDLADAFRQSAAYLRQAVDWALGMRPRPPEAAQAVAAKIRLDDALRGYLAEQGTKRMSREELWRLVAGTTRLRLTARSLNGLPSPDAEPDPVSRALRDQAAHLTSWYDRLADGLTGRDPRPPGELAPPELTAVAATASAPVVACTLWVEQHIQHIRPHLEELTTAANHLAQQRTRPWWR
ncbi:FUSC family protein [Actinomadura sp. LD22]|uniref:FUSC family protein n=2 Tax=Actinomadura physcomitrii TaxID=2650748 RepID=A0A6I4M683_9ACTN|nr:FUSC family protein [Actinomadura physcomitrii]